MIASLVILATSFANAQSLNSDKSLVNFSIKNMKVRTVKGTFTGMKGEIRFDENDLDKASFKVSVDAATVNTDNKKRDDHLRNEDFFHVEEYPQISFESTSIELTSSGFNTKGLLTMHGVTREVKIPFSFSDNQFVGTLDVNRFDYKIGEDTGTTSVAETATLEIIAVAD